MKPLLLLVDLQHDYLTTPHIEPAAGAVVRHTARLLHGCRTAGIPVAHLWTTVSRQRDDRLPHWKTAGLWRCVENTPGHQPPAELAPREGEAVYHKTGYSGFAARGLPEAIRQRHIDTLILAGIHLHACVRQTALDAFLAGLRVWIVEDSVASDDPVHAASTRRYLESRGIRFLSIDQLICDLTGAGETNAQLSGETATGAAVERAGEGAASWRRQPEAARSQAVARLAEMLESQAAGLATLMAQELGKPVRFGRVEVLRSAEMLRAIHRRLLSVADDGVAASAVFRRRPHGVIAVITPWNNPVYLALGKIVPAVLLGNGVVWKPAPEARFISGRISECIKAAGWADGLVMRVEGGRRTAAELMSDPLIAAVTITGSSSAGYCAQEICARRRIPLQAELGGNNAAIVWPDADLAEAAARIAAGAFEMAGQRCTANRRVIVHRDCRATFTELLRRATSALRWGDPLDEATQIGPLVSPAHWDRVAGIVARAVADCGPATFPLGHAPSGPHDCTAAWYPPTILSADDPRHEIVQEETFAPVLVVQTARDWAEAIRLCNGVRQGLAAAVFTRSREVVERFQEEAEAGILKVNQSTADAAVDVPFGGWKHSGLGPPEHGACDVEFYSRPQTVYGTLA